MRLLPHLNTVFLEVNPPHQRQMVQGAPTAAPSAAPVVCMIARPWALSWISLIHRSICSSKSNGEEDFPSLISLHIDGPRPGGVSLARLSSQMLTYPDTDAIKAFNDSPLNPSDHHVAPLGSFTLFSTVAPS